LTRQLQLTNILPHVVLLSPQSYTQAHTDLQVGQSNFSLHSHTPIMAGEAIGVNTRILGVSGGIFKLLWSPEIDSEESIPKAYVAWRAGTRTLFLYSVLSPHRLFKNSSTGDHFRVGIKENKGSYKNS
jgi:hypothetical protein